VRDWLLVLTLVALALANALCGSSSPRGGRTLILPRL